MPAKIAVPMGGNSLSSDVAKPTPPPKARKKVQNLRLRKIVKKSAPENALP